MPSSYVQYGYDGCVMVVRKDKKKIVVEKNDEIIFERGERSDVTDPFFISVHNPSVISRLAVIQKKNPFFITTNKNKVNQILLTVKFITVLVLLLIVFLLFVLNVFVQFLLQCCYCISFFFYFYFFHYVLFV